MIAVNSSHYRRPRALKDKMAFAGSMQLFALVIDHRGHNPKEWICCRARFHGSASRQRREHGRSLLMKVRTINKWKRNIINSKRGKSIKFFTNIHSLSLNLSSLKVTRGGLMKDYIGKI